MPSGVDVARIELATSRLQSERSPAELHARIEKDRATTSSVMGETGLEPVTFRLSAGCSNQLSYSPFHTPLATEEGEKEPARGQVPADHPANSMAQPGGRTPPYA